MAANKVWKIDLKLDMEWLAAGSGAWLGLLRAKRSRTGGRKDIARIAPVNSSISAVTVGTKKGGGERE